MTEATHTCDIGDCTRKTSYPMCSAHREQLSLLSPSLVDKIHREFVNRNQGLRRAALHYQEAISEATRILRESAQPQPTRR